MNETSNSSREGRYSEPRWPSLLAVIAVVGLYFPLHADLIVGPRGLLPSVIVTLLVPTVISHQTGRHRVDRLLGFLVTSLLTVGLIASVVLLVRSLPFHRQSPVALMRSAGSLWCTNILVFALWYWRLDAGGPHERSSRLTHEEGSFLFPQMTLSPEAKRAIGQAMWLPSFMDYLFVAFNTSTAFSPTDTPPLTSWAKSLMMVQSIISLTVIALLAARAVNIL
jgi:hypothetical protein